MAIPLLVLGALGFQGLTRFRDFKDRKKRKAGIQGALDAMLTGSDPGRIAPGEIGPQPRQAGVGGNNLAGQQTEMIRAIAENGNEAAALDMALKMSASNQRQQNFNANLGLQSAQFELQRDRFEQSERLFDFRVSQADKAEGVEATELAAELAAIQSPRLAERRAALAGEDSYTFIDEQTGAATKAFRRGTDEFNVVSNALDKTKDSLLRINNVRTNLRRFGLSGDPASPIAAQLKADIAALQLEFKGEDLFNLGAISGSDAEFLRAIIPDATSFQNQLTSSPAAIDAQLARASDILEASNQRSAEGVRGWVGLEEKLLESGAQQLRASGLDTPGDREILQDEQRRKAIEEIGFFDVDDRLAAARGDQDAIRRLASAQTGLSEQSMLRGISGSPTLPGVFGPQAEAAARQFGNSLFESGGNFASAVGGFLTRSMIAR